MESSLTGVYLSRVQRHTEPTYALKVENVPYKHLLARMMSRDYLTSDQKPSFAFGMFRAAPLTPGSKVEYERAAAGANSFVGLVGMALAVTRVAVRHFFRLLSGLQSTALRYPIRWVAAIFTAVVVAPIGVAYHSAHLARDIIYGNKAVTHLKPLSTDLLVSIMGVASAVLYPLGLLLLGAALWLSPVYYSLFSTEEAKAEIVQRHFYRQGFIVNGALDLKQLRDEVDKKQENLSEVREGYFNVDDHLVNAQKIVRLLESHINKVEIASSERDALKFPHRKGDKHAKVDAFYRTVEFIGTLPIQVVAPMAIGDFNREIERLELGLDFSSHGKCLSAAIDAIRKKNKWYTDILVGSKPTHNAIPDIEREFWSQLARFRNGATYTQRQRCISYIRPLEDQLVSYG